MFKRIQPADLGDISNSDNNNEKSKKIKIQSESESGSGSEIEIEFETDNNDYIICLNAGDLGFPQEILEIICMSLCVESIMRLSHTCLHLWKYVREYMDWDKIYSTNPTFSKIADRTMLEYSFNQFELVYQHLRGYRYCWNCSNNIDYDLHQHTLKFMYPYLGPRLTTICMECIMLLHNDMFVIPPAWVLAQWPKLGCYLGPIIVWDHPTHSKKFIDVVAYSNYHVFKPHMDNFWRAVRIRRATQLGYAWVDAKISVDNYMNPITPENQVNSIDELDLSIALAASKKMKDYINKKKK